MGRTLMDRYLLLEGEELHGQKDPSAIGVTLGRDLSTGRAVVVKAFSGTTSDRTAGVREPLEWETAILTKTDSHPNVVQLLDVSNAPTEIFAVIETVADGGGNLFDAIGSAGRLDDDLARHIFGQLLDALEHCHSRGVCHRDIKPENVLLDTTGNAKLAGFPLASMFDLSTGDGLLEISENEICGTLDYIAPEVIQALGYGGSASAGMSYAGRSADLWSLGVTLYTMLAGYLPFEAETEDGVIDKIQAADFKVDPAMTGPARALLGCLLELDPKKRFTAEQVRSHHWFQRGQRGEARRMEYQLKFPARPQQQQQQQHAPGASSPGPGVVPDSGIIGDGKGDLGRTGGQRDGPGDDGDAEGEKKGSTITEKRPGLPCAVIFLPFHGQAQTTPALPPSLPKALQQRLPKRRQVSVFDVDENFKGSAEAAAFLYGDDADTGNDRSKSNGYTSTPSAALPSSPPPCFTPPVNVLELQAGDLPLLRRRQSGSSRFESVPSFGTPISGFAAHFGAHGTACSDYSERSGRLDTFSSYAMSKDGRSHSISSSTQGNGELYGDEDEEGQGGAQPFKATARGGRSFPGASKLSAKPHPP